MEDHVKRMVAEYDQLNERTIKLQVFLGGPSSDVLSKEQRKLMEGQLEHMLGYQAVLGDRLEGEGFSVTDRQAPDPNATKTLGEQRVRVNFNVTGSDVIWNIKAKSAELIDLCQAMRNDAAVAVPDEAVD